MGNSNNSEKMTLSERYLEEINGVKYYYTLSEAKYNDKYLNNKYGFNCSCCTPCLPTECYKNNIIKLYSSNTHHILNNILNKQNHGTFNNILTIQIWCETGVYNYSIPSKLTKLKLESFDLSQNAVIYFDYAKKEECYIFYYDKSNKLSQTFISGLSIYPIF